MLFIFSLCSVHGNTHRIPHNAFSVEDIKKVVKYLTNHAEDNAILLPGRIPGYHRTDLKLLPSNTTKLGIWESYSSSIQEGRKVGYRSFRNIWTKYMPEIIITKPMSDLCWSCQKNNTLIMRSVNKSEEEISKVITNKLNR